MSPYDTQYFQSEKTMIWSMVYNSFTLLLDGGCKKGKPKTQMCGFGGLVCLAVHLLGFSGGVIPALYWEINYESQ